MRDWGDWADENTEALPKTEPTRESPSPSVSEIQPTPPETLPPEELISVGDVVWARVEGQEAVLRCGLSLTIIQPNTSARSLTRPIRILSVADQRAELVSLTGASLREVTMDDPDELWKVPPIVDDEESPRAPSFPVGHGQGLIEWEEAQNYILTALGIGFVLGFIVAAFVM